MKRTRYPELKVKIKSLADEARVIRAEERCQSGDKRVSLMMHRKDAVRPESRSALIAYGFLRGKTYAQIENKVRLVANWKNVERLVVKYCNHDDPELIRAQFVAWRDSIEPRRVVQYNTDKTVAIVHNPPDPTTVTYTPKPNSSEIVVKKSIVTRIAETIGMR